MSHVEPSWHEAREIAHACVDRLPTEQVRLIEAHGLMTTEDVKALTPLPPSAISAMDGWAVAGDSPWVVIGQVLAGAVWPTPLVAGQAVRIATGAALPLGCDGVLRSEDGLIDQDGSVRGRVRSGGDVRRAGEESHAGEVLIHAGSIMTPARIGLAAAGGHDTVSVRRRPIVRLLVLGDEILAEGPARDGRVRDSLGPQLPGWLVRLGVDLVETVHVEDTLQGQSAALAAAVERPTSSSRPEAPRRVRPITSARPSPRPEAHSSWTRWRAVRATRCCSRGGQRAADLWPCQGIPSRRSSPC